MDVTKKKDAKQLVSDLSAFVNDMCFDADAFVDGVMREHRTLQQNIMRLFMKTIKGWSETERYDLRNEQTIMLSKKIMDHVQNSDGLPYI